MATDTALPIVPDPSAAPAPPDAGLPGGPMRERGVIASMLAPVAPARPTADTAATPSAGDSAGTALGSSADYHGAAPAPQVRSSASGAEKTGIARAFLLAAANRWAKGGGTANRKLELDKARVQANQVKETRQVSVNRSGPAAPRREPAAGPGGKAPVNKGGDKAQPKKDLQKSNGSSGLQNSPAGPSGNSAGRGSSGAGTDSRKGSGGTGRGTTQDKSGGRGKSGAGDGKGATTGGAKGGSDGATKSPRKGATGGADGGATKERPKPGTTGASGGGKSGGTDKKSGAAGRGASGGASDGGRKDPLRKDGGVSPGGGRSGAGSKTDGQGKGTQQGQSSKGSGSGGPTGSGSGGSGKDGGPGKQGKDGKPGKDSGSASGGSGPSGKQQSADGRPSLQKSREVGHGDGSKARRAVDHVKAYADGARDGWGDEKDKNAAEHGRLNTAHDKHTAGTPGQKGPVQGPGSAGPSGSKSPDLAKQPMPPKPQVPPKPAVPPKPPVTGQSGRGTVTVTVTDDAPGTPMEDPFMSQPTPIQAKGIDASRITFPGGDAFTKSSVSRGEMRCFKQYEGRLEARIDGLAKVAEATKQLAAQAHEQADDCQKLAEEGKGVEGGDDLVAALARLAESAKTQADEADEVHARAARAHDFAEAVLSNVQTRYQPLYQAVVDSPLTKPAELKFYADRGIYPSDMALSA